MDADPHDEFGFPLSLSEQFRGRTIPFTNIRPQSSATQDEDWHEESTASRMDAMGQAIAKRGLTAASVNADALWLEGETTKPAGINPGSVDTTTACIGRLLGEAFWAWAERMGRGE